MNQVIKLSITGKPLKPCPFCGSKKVSMYDESIRDFFRSEDRYLIECDRCNANIERYSETGVKRARREGDEK